MILDGTKDDLTLLRTAFDLIGAAIFVHDDRGRFVGANRAVTDLYGYDREEILSMSIPDIDAVVVEGDYPSWYERFLRDRVAHFETLHRRKDGTLFPVAVSAHMVARGEAVLVFSITTDITERKRAEETLRNSEEKFARTFRHAPVPMSISTVEEGRFLDVNEAFCRITGYSREEILGRTVTEAGLLSPGSRRRLLERVGSFPAEDGHVADTEVTFRTKDGHERSTIYGSVPFTSGGVTRLVSIGVDITERKAAEEKLRESEERSRRLAAHQQEAVEAERSRIAREIHDELAQQLTVQRMDLVWLRKRVSPQGEAAAKIDEMLSGLEKTRAAVGNIIHSMRPRILDDLGLPAALDWAAQEFRKKTGIAVRLSLPEEEVEAGPTLATHLYRIAQEALTNVARHAEAHSVSLSLSSEGGRIVLSVEDDGRGIAPGEAAKAGSFGILGMEERAAQLGGTFSIRSLPEGGTGLSVSVPLSASVARDTERAARLPSGGGPS
jgi:PAS domain S-box-containing protein